MTRVPTLDQLSSVPQQCEAAVILLWVKSIFLCASGTSDVWEVIHRAYKRSSTVRELKTLILSTRDDSIALRLLKGEKAYTGTIYACQVLTNDARQQVQCTERRSRVSCKQ
eukprot:GHVU01207570.1.p1 GENE.GHVU01207570.1~~GHVU01207570.1.p1  ORF type:complete len:111 (+),score=5.16 GHVU01207570.1:551-883(+)